MEFLMKKQAVIFQIIFLTSQIFSAVIAAPQARHNVRVKHIAVRAAAIHIQNRKNVLKKQRKHARPHSKHVVRHRAKPIKRNNTVHRRVTRKNKPAPRVIKKRIIPVPAPAVPVPTQPAAVAVAIVAPAPQVPVPAQATAQDVARECPICQEPKDMYRLACGHEACKDCLHQILETAVHSHDTSTIKCPMPGCRQPFNQADIDQVANDQALVQTIADLKHREEMVQDPRMRQCPTIDCPYTYLFEGNLQQITCPQCHQSYCSNCRVNHAQNVTCEQAQQNQGLAAEHANEEQATEEFIRNATKQCPNCHAPIERRDGCNHMRCTNCHYEFCWLCMMRWPGYDRHACPTFGNNIPAQEGMQGYDVLAPY
jgi:hypothetical protein